MRLLILGMGSSGRAATALAARLGCETVALDGDDAFPESGAFDGAIVSPGIPLDHPWQAACRAAGIPLKSELQFGCEELKRRGVRLLAVTGSKGKSSVVKLVADALARAGRRAVPCGNYGTPVCDVALARVAAQGERRETRGERAETRDEKCESWAVVEVSSFQLETTNLPPDTFEAAAILNLQEDHLDRHGSVAVYHALKLTLLGFAKTGLSCCRTSVVPSGARETASVQQQACGAAKTTSVQQQACGAEKTASVQQQACGAEKTTSVQQQACGAEKTTSAQQQACGADLLAGSYFDNEVLRGNGAAAVFLLRAAGLGDAEIRAAFAAFEPLPHRMNAVGVYGGVTCIDDSKATSLAALAAGLRMASSPSVSRLSSRAPSSPAGPRVRLIAGGLPKGDDPKSVLGDLTARVKKVYLIGQSAEQFFSAWSESVACEICGTMDRAVEAAMREAESGETLLLSPGTASFDQFHGFGERGDVFADLVKKEGTDK